MLNAVKYKYVILFIVDIIILCLLAYVLLYVIYTTGSILYEILSGAGLIACVFFAYIIYAKFEKETFN